MRRYDRVIDGYGQQYAVMQHGCDNEEIVTRPLYSSGRVGSPLRQPRCLLRPNGQVYLRHDMATWFMTDRRPNLRVATS